MKLEEMGTEMKRILFGLIGIIGAGVFWISGITGLASEEGEHEISYDQVASESERAGSSEVGVEGTAFMR